MIMEAPPFITARPAAALLAWSGEKGCEVPALVRALKLDASALADPDGRMPLARYYDLLERLAKRLGPHMGLEFCRAMDERKWERANVLGTASATVGEGLERMFLYMPLWNSGERIWLERRGAEAAILYAPHGRARPAHRIKAEMTLADMSMMGRRYAGDGRLRLVRFRHRQPSPLHEMIFAAPVELGAAVDEMIFDAALLERAVPTANPNALEFVERQLRAQLAEQPRRFSERAREALREILTEDPTLTGLARRMGLTPRTLQRQLQADGTSHQRLLDDTRRESALHKLAEGVAISEVAFLLGFSEPSAFHRAFKRWTGKTPQAWLASGSPRM
jgi:AraC-like DNA-binding protein